MKNIENNYKFSFRVTYLQKSEKQTNDINEDRIKLAMMAKDNEIQKLKDTIQILEVSNNILLLMIILKLTN